MINNLDFIEQQKKICEKYNQEYFATDWNLKIGVSENLKSGIMPINGLRHYPEGDTSGWYIWAGEYSDADDFFEPMHLFHLEEFFPEIIKYLSLPAGNRFLIDDKGYEDVWFDEDLLFEEE